MTAREKISMLMVMLNLTPFKDGVPSSMISSFCHMKFVENKTWLYNQQPVKVVKVVMTGSANFFMKYNNVKTTGDPKRN